MPETPLTQLEFRPPRAVLVRKALGRWGSVAIVNGVFLMVLIVFASYPGSIKEGGVVPLALGLAVAYALMISIVYAAFPSRAMVVRRGVLYLPHPMRTLSRSKVRTVPLRAISEISASRAEGHPAVRIVLSDGTSLDIPEADTGTDGRLFLERLGSQLRKATGEP